MFAFLPLVLLPLCANAGSTPKVVSTDASVMKPTAFAMKSRVYIPYDGTGTKFGYGMGAAEQIAYDPVQKYAYAISEQGAINVIDLNDPANMMVKPELALDLTGTKLTDIEICSAHGIMFVGSGAADTVSNGKVHIFKAVQRSSPEKPTLLKEETVGPLPDMLLPNSKCTAVAVANEGEGKYTGGLTDPAGSVDILTLTVTGSPATAVSVTKSSVSFTQWSDADLLSKGVHLPLTQAALAWWDTQSPKASDLDFTLASAYTAAQNLEPEYLAWSHDDATLYVNLQENNAVVAINTPASSAPSVRDISSLGMKDHGSVPIDIAKDKACTQKTYAGFKALRMPDSIQAVMVDNKMYVITANEGDDKEYGDFEEKQKLKDIFKEDGSLESEWNMTVTAEAKATAAAVRADASKMRITVGSSAIDYSKDVPVFQSIVAMGGRGLSIYEDTGSSLSLVWDSAGSFETELCAAFPWAHNSIQDEEMSPVNGILYNTSSAKLKETIEEMNNPDKDGCQDGGDGKPGACPTGQLVDDRSPKDGSGTEAVVAGIACGSLVAITATEKSSGLFVYDITNVKSPTKLFVDHLSKASEKKNPGIAYGDRSLGEIDPEAMVFLSAQDSPSGKPGVLIGGAWSGTMSFWEFSCPGDSAATTTVANPSANPSGTEPSVSGAATVSSSLFAIAAVAASM